MAVSSMPSFSLLVAAVAAALFFPVAHAVEYFSPDWVIPPNIGSPYPSITVNAGDSLTFSWSQGTHDVWIYPSGSCEETGKVQVGSIQDNPTTYTFSEAEAGQVVTFACDIGSHCAAGMLMAVNVLAAETTEEPDKDSVTVPPTSIMGDETEEPDEDSITVPPTSIIGNEPTVADEEGVEDDINGGQFSACYVCGEVDAEIGNPETIVSLPNPTGPNFDVSCTELYQDGLDGIIPDESCAFISQYANIPCGCTPANFSCNICGVENEDLVVRNSDQEITLPANPVSGDGVSTTTCGEFFAAGQNGELTPGQCQSAPVFAFLACQCAPEDFTCSICGEGFKVNAPDDSIIFPSGERGTCADLETQGANGELGPAACAGVADFALGTGTCSCVPEEGYPECLICGVNTTQPMTPEFNLTLSPNDVDSCAALYDEGLAGGLSPVRCLAAQAQSLFGCNCAPADFTCSVCGGNGTDVTMMAPENNFTVPGGGILVNCGELETAGFDGAITPNDCSIISPLVQARCGCAPVGFTCNICGDDSGLSVTDGTATFLPQNDVTCASAEASGLAGELDPVTCGFYQTLAVRACGCEEDGTIAPTQAATEPTTTVVPVAPSSTTEAPVAVAAAPTEAPVAGAAPAAVAPVTSGTDFMDTDPPVVAATDPVAAPVAAAVPGSVDGATGTSQESTDAASGLALALPAVLAVVVAVVLV